MEKECEKMNTYEDAIEWFDSSHKGSWESLTTGEKGIHLQSLSLVLLEKERTETDKACMAVCKRWRKGIDLLWKELRK